MALPNIKSKIFDYSTPQVRNQNLQSKRLDGSFNLQKSVETLEQFDYYKTPRHQKSHSFSLAVSNELIKLEHDLDFSEMRMNRASDYEQFEVYRNHFDSLTKTLKLKDEKLSRLLAKISLGYERLFLKLKDLPKIEIKTIEKQVKPKIDTQDISLQVDISPAKTYDIEYDNLKSLPSTLNKIKLSRISNHLEQLYDNLTQMQTEIPTPTSSPELEPLENTDTNRYLNLKMTIMRENITKILKNPELSIKRLGIDKSIQVSIEAKGSLMNALEMMNKEKELDIFKLRSQNSINLNQKSKLEDAVLRGNNLNMHLENKINDCENELSQLKKENVGLAHKNQELVDKVQKLNEIIEKMTRDLKESRKFGKNLKNLLMKKQKMLQSTLDQLFNSQVMLKVAEKKLKNIEKGYLDKTGQEFKYKDINIIEITKKAALHKTKLKSIDNEIEENELSKDNDIEQDIEPDLVIIEVNNVRPHKETVKSRRNSTHSRNLSQTFEESEEITSSDDEKAFFSGETWRKSKAGYGNEPKSRNSQEFLSENWENKEGHVKSMKKAGENGQNKSKVMEKREGAGPNEKLAKNEEDEKVLKNEKGFLDREEFLRNSVRREPRPENEINHEEYPIKKVLLPNSETLNISYKDPISLPIDPKATFQALSDPISQSSPSSNIPKSQANPSKTSKSQNPSKILKPNLPKSSNPSQSKVPPSKSTSSSTRASQVKDSNPANPPTSKNSLTEKSKDLAPNPRTSQDTTESAVSKISQSLNPLSPSNTSNQGKDLQSSPSNPSNPSNPLSQVPLMSSNNSLGTQVPMTIPTPPHQTQAPFPAPAPGPFPGHMATSSHIPASNLPPCISKSDQSCNSEVIKSTSTQLVPGYVPSKFGKIFKAEDIKGKSDNSLFEQETLSRSFDTEKISSFHIFSECPWFATLTDEQLRSFQFFQEKMIQIRAALAASSSKEVQCLLLDDSVFFDQRRFGKDKEKYKELLGKVFDDEQEIDELPNFVKMRIQRELKGHRKECQEVCEHLKRVMRIKQKIRGVPYPLKLVKM